MGKYDSMDEEEDNNTDEGFPGEVADDLARQRGGAKRKRSKQILDESSGSEEESEENPEEEPEEEPEKEPEEDSKLSSSE